MRRRALSLVLLFALSGCLGGGSAQFKKGQKAYAQGDIELAEKAYAEASAKDPSNKEYTAALSRVRKEMAGKHIADARAKEKARDWTGASGAWGRAAELVPDESDYAVRRDLSGQKAKNLGPDEWFAAVSVVSGQHPDNEIGKRSLAGARAAAYQHNLALGEEFLAAGDGTRALQYFDRAKQVDPSTPGLRVDAYAQAEALAVADRGDLALDQGDPIRAYELYQEAYAKRAMPAIKRKLTAVKRKASALLSKLDRARKQADRGQYKQALRSYESLMGQGGVPGSVAEEVKKVRGKLVEQDCKRARKDIDRGNLRRAQSALRDAVKNAQLDAVKADVLLAGYAAGARGKPDQTLKAIESAGLEEGTPLEEASNAYAVAAAKQILKKAERKARRDGAAALRMIAPLDAFREDLPGIGELRRKLRSDSFQDLLDGALAAAKKGNDGEAAAQLLAALNSSKAPDSMRTPATEGAEHLKVGRYAAAETSFTAAQAAAPRSRLAQRGIDVARLRRKSAESAAVATLKRGTGDQDRAVETLEAAAGLEPGNANAKAGADALVDRLSKSSNAPEADIAKLVRWAARLASLPAAAKDGLLSGADSLKDGDFEGAATAFKGAEDAAPGEKLPKLASSTVSKRRLGALKGDVAAVLEGDETAAEALAELLESKPSDPTGQRVLRQLVEKARKLAAEKKDADAARYLKLATIATAPAPGVKTALDNGHEALAKSDMAAAEKAYEEAKDLEAGQIVAEAGYAIARGARNDALTKALAGALSGGSTDALKAALAAAVAADPNSPEAKETFEALLAAAQKQADGGNVARAAQLLEAANAVSKPQTAKDAITAANAKLEAKDYSGAQAAYGSILEGGDSKIAVTGNSIAKEQQLGGLVGRLEGLQNGRDIEGGAKAAAELAAIDPANQKVARAVDATLTRAEKAADKGDDKTAAKELKAAAIALSELAALEPAIASFEKGDFPAAQDGFSSSESALGRRGAALARRRNLGTLAGNLDKGGEDAARSIRRLLKADPNNAGAKKAFDGLLAKVRSEATAKKDGDAATSLKHASIAAGAPSDLSGAIEVGADHFAAARYASAEVAFTGALELAKDSVVAKTGHEVSKQSRQREEQAALRGLSNEDPRPHATQLKTSLLVDPKSAVVAKGLQTVLARARRAADKGDDVQLAQCLEAAAPLAESSAEDTAGILEGSAKLAKSSHAEAQTRFATVNAGRERPEDRSAVAELGEALALKRRIAVLKADLAKAEKDKDVLRQSTLVARILELDANDRDATRKAKVLVPRVKAERYTAAQTQKEQGKLGVSYLYLNRALELDAKDSKAKALLADVEGQLKKRLDLILVVEGVKRDNVPSTRCKGFDGMLQVALQTVASKRTDLGGYVLSPAWTAAVKKGDERAPEVSGSLVVTMKACSLGSSTGKAGFEWQILTPQGGDVVATGEVKADLPSGTIPRDEQDGAGKNARKAFSTRAAEQISEKISTERDQTDTWLMGLAEYGIKQKDPALVADAWARMKVKASRMVDVERLLKVERYLDEQFR